MSTHVDRGGTFTDVVRIRDGLATLQKVRSDRAVIGRLAEGALTFGTTVATNALLERTGVRTLLIVTRGFKDLPWIGDMSRPSLFDPEACWPEPLCGRVLGVDGRLDREGLEIEPLVLPEPDLDEIDAVAVVLLNSHRNGDHERRVAAAIRRQKPDCFVVLGHQISPELGYLARIETALVDAAITPLLQRAIERDEIDVAQAIRSDGSLCPVGRFRAPDAVLSGPAGGVLAVAHVAELAGFRSAVGLDMGGTSTDVCRVDVGDLPRREGSVRVAGVRLRRPMLEVHTIAAGGGSICWSDGLQLGVGPRSAGADPGPQCYGRGGPPTLTDAALLAGLVDPLAFDPPLAPERVTLPAEPAAFLDIARDAMAEAVRTLATARGIDVDDHALVAYGGAAGQHAAHVATRLGISTVLLHPLASGLSAFGQTLARREETAVRALWLSLDRWEAVETAWSELETELSSLLSGECVRSVHLRHQGTDHAIEIVAATAKEASERFAAAHRQRYGFDRDQPIEIVDARVRVRAPAPEVPRVQGWALSEERLGPFVLHSSDTSVVVPEGWRARTHGVLLRLDRVAQAERRPSSERTPLGVTLWGNRFMAIAEQAGAVLGRLARSVNIRERLDYSCAIFDPEGGLVANAPHIPVHLGAMGATVRDLLAHCDPEPGQAYLCNDPAAGGSHLPDLTVVTPVQLGQHLVFVGCRGHHVDVGGLTPGSMPPHSRSLSDEGFVVRHRPLLEDGRLCDLSDLLQHSRAPDQVLADLEAQVASNRNAASALRDCGPPDLVIPWMRHLQDVADEAVGRVWARLEGEAEDTVGGLALRVRITGGERLLVDFSGTGGPHAGNLNAPRSVVRAAVLYALRVLVAEPIPLNEGALRRVEIRVPPASLLDPPAGAAIVGGNVETSQRLVDLLLRATGRLAASQGTMNNLTLGGADWAFYETIGGGQGAGPHSEGAWGRQVHMTNTRATDAEVLEARLPLRLWRCERRLGSGGAGSHFGGDGLVREIELVSGGTAALLATRRSSGAPGLHGGGPGRPGVDSVFRGGSWEAWDGGFVDLDGGSRVRIASPGGGGWGSSV